MRSTQLTLKEHFFNPANVGDANEPSFVGRVGSLRCGAIARLSLQVGEGHQIVEAKFKATGCDALVASLSVLTENIRGATSVEAAAMAQDPQALIGLFSDLHSEQIPCVSLACQALLNAVREYSNAARDEWNGDDVLICTCFCVSEKAIEQVISEGALTTVAEVTRACYAGGGCGSCHSLIVEMIEQTGT